MSRRGVYLVQADTLRRIKTRSTAYLPYTAAALWACAAQSPAVAEGYDLRDILFLRAPVNGAAAGMEAPFLAGFSCYSWNTEYNKALARAVKRLHPGCYILFGGHNVPPGGAMLDELPDVDFLLHGEGEPGFRVLLEQLLREQPDLTAVPGLSYRAGETTAINAEAALESFAGLPSPYLSGLLDPIVAAHPDIRWNAVLETNRGCPNHCVFCDWGRHRAALRQFSMERVTAEIDWMSTHGVEYIMCADANFGVLPRDEAILDHVIEARGRTGRPRVFFCSSAKTDDEGLFRIIEKLNESGLDRIGPNFAVQSLSPEVLRNIGRKNLDDAALARWIRRCRKAGYRSHTDLILGLPGETLQSFCAGVEKLLGLGQHAGIQYFPCALLPNAAMAAPAFREKHGIRTARKIFRQTMEDAPDGEQIDEYLNLVDETASMPHAHWREANFFMILAQGAHCFGSLRLPAMYLHTEGIVPYAEFYLALLAFCRARPDTLPGEAMARVEQNFIDALGGTEPEPLQIPFFGAGRLYEDQYFFGQAVLAPERFYSAAEIFLRQFGLEPALAAQLLRYQRESLLLPGGALEKTREFAYDFPAYFEAIYDGAPVPLERRAVRLRLTTDCDLTSAVTYYDVVMQTGRYSGNAFYRTEYLPL